MGCFDFLRGSPRRVPSRVAAATTKDPRSSGSGDGGNCGGSKVDRCHSGESGGLSGGVKKGILKDSSNGATATHKAESPRSGAIASGTLAASAATSGGGKLSDGGAAVVAAGKAGRSEQHLSAEGPLVLVEAEHDSSARRRSRSGRDFPGAAEAAAANGAADCHKSPDSHVSPTLSPSLTSSHSTSSASSSFSSTSLASSSSLSGPLKPGGNPAASARALAASPMPPFGGVPVPLPAPAPARPASPLRSPSPTRAFRSGGLARMGSGRMTGAGSAASPRPSSGGRGAGERARAMSPSGNPLRGQNMFAPSAAVAAAGAGAGASQAAAVAIDSNAAAAAAAADASLDHVLVPASSHRGFPVLDRQLAGSGRLSSFSLAQLHAATCQFALEGLLGSGGFGSVFKGTMWDGRSGRKVEVAVKVLNTAGQQGDREWQAELQVLARLHHSCLVPLLGVCAEGDQRLLVYPFLPGGSLERRLFPALFLPPSSCPPPTLPTGLSLPLAAPRGGGGGAGGGGLPKTSIGGGGAGGGGGAAEGDAITRAGGGNNGSGSSSAASGSSMGGEQRPLQWLHRIRIAIAAAKGLVFLHEEVAKPIIYRDFKTSNILLDRHGDAQLSDFGLARLGPQGELSHVTTRVVGTVGYAAPEYVLTGHLSTRSDVWGFGVVLLELLTGRPALDKTRPKHEQSLVDWAAPFLSAPSKLYRIMDPALSGIYSVRGAQLTAAIARQCLSAKPKQRPLMSKVLSSLLPVLDLHDMAGFTLDQPIGGGGGGGGGVREQGGEGGSGRGGVRGGNCGGGGWEGGGSGAAGVAAGGGAGGGGGSNNSSMAFGTRGGLRPASGGAGLGGGGRLIPTFGPGLGGLSRSVVVGGRLGVAGGSVSTVLVGRREVAGGEGGGNRGGAVVRRLGVAGAGEAGGIGVRSVSIGEGGRGRTRGILRSASGKDSREWKDGLREKTEEEGGGKVVRREVAVVCPVGEGRGVKLTRKGSGKSEGNIGEMRRPSM